MSGKWTKYLARFEGDEYTATLFTGYPEETDIAVHLHRDSAAPQFEGVTSELYVRQVSLQDCEVVSFVRTVCQWRSEPFVVAQERGNELLIEYVGGSYLTATELGLERVERGVYRTWVPHDEIRGMRQDYTFVKEPSFD